ncbi:MAG: FAD-dependent oxidoreductase, partial [Cyclobacteriaceae bacterium]|nr:FAD-dependent oxidoreductase [Cyclobacteriaceae bacterium]
MSEDEVKIWVPDSDLPRVVVVGAGFAGISFIQKLKNKPFQVILLDKNNYHQFQPLLYQVATSGLEPDSITFPVRKLFKGQRNFVFRVAEVERIDTNAKRIYTNVGSLGFDYLVLGTGSDTNFYGLEAVQRNSIGLKSITDSL